jgi:5-formyltetrahydrofolate cyclo-ligase
VRQRRNALSEADQAAHAENLAQRLCQHPEWPEWQHIAGYWPTDGEISPLPFLAKALQAGKKCYLPCLDKVLRFAVYTLDTPLTLNRYQIFEPSHPDWIPLAQLDCVLVPIVAFDRQKHRLGRGGGFYDKTFVHMPTPTLMGIAHALQEVPSITPASWDIVLKMIATEREIL